MASLGRLMITVAIFAAVWGIYTKVGTRAQHAAQTLESPATPVEKVRSDPAESRDDAFACDGRTYCSQMKSCAEAKYFRAHCPNVKMDGDHDGVPCESQWCPNG